MNDKINPPEGWFHFGTHVEYSGEIEFSKELGEDLMPLWERPVDKETNEKELDKIYQEIGEYERKNIESRRARLKGRRRGIPGLD